MGQVKLVWRAEEVDSGKEKESPAARAGEIEGTDKRDRDQNNDGGEQSEDDHCNLLKMLEREVQAENQKYALCFQQVAMQEYAEKWPKADSCGPKFTPTQYWNWIASEEGSL
jgi:hypothetical protein